jgi:ADP-ribose pyrophosphatase YjhB (NUDIX family)
MITNLYNAIKQANKYTKIKTTILVLDKDDNLIILKRSSNDENGNCWELPGGGIEKNLLMNEKYLLSEASREVLEESGLIVDNIKFAYMLEFTNPKGFLQGNYMFIAKVKSNIKPSISCEHNDYLVVNTKIATQKLSFENHINLVNFYINNELQ